MILTFIEDIQISTLMPFILILIILSIIWDIFFVKRIRHLVFLYRECMEKAKTDPFGNFLEAAQHFKVEIHKYTFLLVINVTEFGTMQIYALGALLALIHHPNDILNSSIFIISNCTTELAYFNNIMIDGMFKNPSVSILVSIGQAGLLFSIALGICLMKYLDVKYHDIYGKTARYIRKFLLVTVMLGIFLIIAGSVPQLMLIEKVVEPILLLIYFSIWVKYTRTFYKTLKWRTIEHRVRGESNRVVKRSLISSYQFAIIMSCMLIGFAGLILAEFLTQYFTLITTILYYGPCIFNYLYATPDYQTLLVTQQQIEALHISDAVIRYFSIFLFIFACTIFGSQYILATSLFFGQIIVRKLNYRFGYIPIRFTPSLTDSLLAVPH